MGTTRLEVISDRGKIGADAPFANPLPIRPGVGEAIAHRSWTQARKAVLAALLDLPCVVVIQGAPGTGKTLLLADLARALADAGAAPVLFKRGDLAGDPVAMAAEGPANTRIVLIDEADRMSDAALARFAALAGSGLVLAHTDDPTADARFALAVGERRLTVVRLEPLGDGEIRALLAASLARAGRPADLIGDDAVARIAWHSGGVPRLVNMLASAALFLAASESSGQVNAGHVDDAAEMSGLTDSVATDLPPVDGEAVPPDDAEPLPEVPEIAPADLAAIAQSWADAAIVEFHPERAAAAPLAARNPARAAAPDAADPPPLRAVGDSRIARPVAARAGAARRRAAAAAAVLLLVGAGAGSWVALHRAGPAGSAPPQEAVLPLQPQVASANPAATAGLPSPSAGGPVGEGASSQGKAAPPPADPPAAAAPAPAHVASGRKDAPAAFAKPESDTARPSASAAVLPPLHPPGATLAAPPAARAHASVRTNGRPLPPTGEAEPGRASRAVHPRAQQQPEGDRQVGGILGVLREYSAREPAPERDPGSAAGEVRRSGETPSRPQAEPPGAGYVGSYVMGPDGRRMFVQDP